MEKKPPSIIDSNKLALGIFFITIGWFLVSSSYFWLLIAPILWFIGLNYFSSSVLLYRFAKPIEAFKTILLWLPVVLLLSSIFLPISLFGLAIAFFIFGAIARYKLNKATDETRYLLAANKTNTSHKKPIRRKRKKTSQQKLNAKNTNKNSSDTQIDHFSINVHAYSLNLLVSKSVKHTLQELIDALNSLAKHSSYLQANHGYLATSVRELIHDLRDNTLLRLDKLANTFVSNGTVDSNAQAMFAKKHEAKIAKLLTEHLYEVQGLTNSIIEKQMAEFEQVGSDAEKQFRDTVMELKILLRWHIAQTPDDAVTSHEVLLKKLEASTLKQMLDVFTKADTSTEQRNRLQTQIDELLLHFKTTLGEAVPSKQNSDTDKLLLLEYQPNNLSPSEANQFLDFNEQYIKQLKTHWK